MAPLLLEFITDITGRTIAPGVYYRYYWNSQQVEKTLHNVHRKPQEHRTYFAMNILKKDAHAAIA